MDVIKFFDTTLRDGEQAPDCTMNISEKRKFAIELEKLGVDVIEAGFPVTSKGDFLAIREISKVVEKPVIAALCRVVKEDIDVALDSLIYARKKRLHIFIAASEIHMNYKLNMTKDEVKQRVYDVIKYAKSRCDQNTEIEFSAEDATRSDYDFLVEIFNIAIKAGANVINMADTVGYITPDEFYHMVSYIKERLVAKNIILSVHCHNDLGMATANSLAAIKAGASQVECTVNGIGERAGNAALEEIVMSLMTRKDIFNKTCNINTKNIYRISRMLSAIIGFMPSANKAIIGANAFVHESGIHQHGVLVNKKTYEIMSPKSIGMPEDNITLGKHSGRHAIENRLCELGYVLPKSEIDKIFVGFKEISDKKKIVTDCDLQALVDHLIVKIPDSYSLDRFIVNCGNTITSMATVRLKKDDELIEKAAMGDGPIDAAYKAIEKIAKCSLKLDNYYIRSVSEGEDALGEVIVKVRDGNKTVTGRGLSTDIIEASILAYINAVNKSNL